MKLIYLVMAIILAAIQGPLIVRAIRRHDVMSPTIASLLGASLVAAILYICAQFVYSEWAAKVFWGAFYFAMDLILFFMISYASNVHTLRKKRTSNKVVLYIYMAWLLLDFFSMVVNVYTGHAFTLELEAMGAQWNWDTIGHWGFYVHLSLCYLCIGLIVFILIRNLVQTPKYFRKEYVRVLIFFAISIAVNAVGMIWDWKLNYSILLYQVISIEFYHFYYHIIPKETEYRMQSLISEQIEDALACFDKDGHCIRANQAAKKLFGVTNENFDVIEQYLSVWLYVFPEKDKDYIRGEDIFELDGKEHIFITEYRRFRDAKNRVQGGYLKLDDKTDEMEKIREQKHRATHDALTGVLNREAFFEQAAAILARDPMTPRYMIGTNIKDFKLINELFGQGFADEILKRQADMLSKAQYENCICARITADRFAMLIAKEDFKPDMALKNTSIVQELVSDVSYKINIHIGVYEIENPHEPVNSMYDKALMAIQNVKDVHEQRLVFYDTFLMERLMHKKNVLAEFDKALEEGQFCIYLQAQIDVNRKVVGAEALVRWNHPQNGLVPPFQFIPILEETGYIHRLDYYVWELAAKKLRQWKDEGNENYHISVNISTRDFYYMNLYEVFTNLVKKYEISPRNLKLEITETSLIRDLQRHKQTLTQLSEYGFDIEMDDFGSGYSSLRMLEDLGVDVLKIDMEFLRKSEHMERAKTIIRSIINMARKLNMKVITEGVEELAQVDFLTESGCDYFQGYYFSKPIPVEEFEEKYMSDNKEVNG